MSQLEIITNDSRREFIIGISAGIMAGLFPSHLEASVDYSKIPPPDLGYKPVVRERSFRGVKLPPLGSEVGSVQRTLRFKNITEAVGARYGIKPEILLGMICAESEGDPTQPNKLGDGGVGLVHMQPKLSTKYGLRLITNSRRLRDFEQGKELRWALEETNGDLKKLIEYDDRWHPIKNVDAAARMLCDNYRKTHSWGRALELYAGRSSYDSKVLSFAKKMNDPKFLRLIEFNFDRTNGNATNLSKPLKFKDYIAAFQRQNVNYGLNEYQKLPKHRVA